MPKVFLPEMTFAEVEDILDQVELAVIPTGSNEGHGPHLPLKVDAATSTFVACRAAEKLYPQVLVTPTLAVGHSPQHLEFPGSMTLRVHIHQQHPSSLPCKACGQIDRRCGLPTSPFLVDHADDSHNTAPFSPVKEGRES